MRNKIESQTEDIQAENKSKKQKSYPVLASEHETTSSTTPWHTEKQ